MQSLCELSVMFPVAGSFTAFSTRFIDPSWGFALGWIYFLQWLFVLPLEIIAAVLTITYWNDSVPKAVFVTIFLVFILGINLSNIRIYGEAEFILSIIKVIAVVGFILLGIVIHIGGPPHSGYIGGQYWSHPGPFNNGFKGFSSALMTAVFSYGGTEIVGLAAAETRSPLKSIPNAIKHIFWRIAIFYLVTILLIGLLVPSNNSSLINGKSSADASASAFVIAIESAGTTILPSVMNSVILIAVLSVGNSAIYASSRTLAAMAELSHAPRVFTYVDKKGRPLLSLLIAGCFGLLAYLVDLEAHDTIFQWLLSISAFGILFAWTSICFCHIRLRMAWIHASRPIDRLPFRSAVGVIGSWLTIAGYVMVMALHMWVSISPLQASGEEMSLPDRVQYFFLRTMALPIVAVLFIYHKIRFRTHFISVAEMDLDTGRRSYRFDLDREQDADVRRTWPIWKKVFNYLC
ncbi:amino acid transporter AAT family [Fusarium subglutinans]|uniref:Amino acid transporter AAT family n=1 Tax=Gibberella subglutinans TaxID=42677 RepID=A0A8H5L4S0_GIBSU|nr:amino acid transporter AAT family [Fusarium subglutinans]KAF5585342.1 amino acid transporter AAT family [Fusarium subglutinans]